MSIHRIPKLSSRLKRYPEQKKEHLLTLRLRLILMASGIAIVATIAIAVIVSQTAISRMEQDTKIQYEANLTAKQRLVSAEVSMYFETIEHQIVAMAFDQSVVSAATKFSAAFSTFADEADAFDEQAARKSLEGYYTGQFKPVYDDANERPAKVEPLFRNLSASSVALQYSYISNNDLPLGDKDGLTTLLDDSEYNKVHTQFHPSIRKFLREFGFYDIFIVEAKSGHVVYSVFKELDYATSLLAGPYKDSGLGGAFKKGLQLAPGETFLTDFSAYVPSYNSPASFISTPIQENGETVAVLIYQMPIDRINGIMTQQGEWMSNGFGASGEVYLVGQDKTLRNESRFFIESPKGYFDVIAKAGIAQHSEIKSKNTSILLQPVNSFGVQQALAGKSGFDIYPDYRDVPVMSAYAPIIVGDMTWAIASEIDQAEAFAASTELSSFITYLTAVSALLIAAFAIVISIFFASRLVRPLNELSDRLESMAEGDADLTRRVTLHGTPEIDRIALGFNQFAELLRSVMNQVKQSAFDISSTSTELHATMEQSSQTIHSQARDIQDVDAELVGFASSITEVAEQTRMAVLSTAEARDNAERNSETAKMASGNIQQLVDEVTASGSKITHLQTQVTSIAEVLSLINAIADQTNLLALNAAIEAARAGEHGRGFAVVADEVRTLAARTQESTVTIQQQIDQLDASAGASVESMSRASTSAKGGIHLVEGVSSTLIGLRDHVAHLSELNQSVAGANEKQQENIQVISGNMNNIMMKANALSSSSGQVTEAAQNLSSVAERLRSEVSRFIT